MKAADLDISTHGAALFRDALSGGNVEPLLDRPGDVWAYMTPILHTSARSVSDRRRRVLRLDYSAAALPGDLEWLGVSRQ